MVQTMQALSAYGRAFTSSIESIADVFTTRESRQRPETVERIRLTAAVPTHQKGKRVER